MSGKHQSGEQHDDARALSDEDKLSVIEALVEEMSELFHGYIQGDTAFEELTFEMYDTLQTLHAIANNSLMIEYYDESGSLDGDMFENLAEGENPPYSNGSQAHGADSHAGGNKGKRRR